MELFFVTGNENKLREASKILGFDVKSAKIDVPEEQEIEVDKIIESKAKAAYEKVKQPVIVEDTGLYFEAMNGFPGALIKWVLKSIGNEGAVKMLNGHDHRNAYAKTGIGYFDGENFKIFSGIIKGKISEEPRGKNGFGWDMIFIPENYEKTFAEMTDEEKNNISMRKIAFENLKSFLQP
ncbi:MAG: XTP/dITP diphosphatase [Nanoarchaeota archaeon]